MGKSVKIRGSKESDKFLRSFWYTTYLVCRNGQTWIHESLQGPCDMFFHRQNYMQQYANTRSFIVQNQKSAKYHSHWNLQHIFQHFYGIELWSITVRGETNKIRQSNNTQQSPEFSVQKRNKKNVLSLNISFQHQSMLGDEWLWSLIAIIPKKLQLSLISISRIFLVLSFIFLATIWTISATDEARTQKKYLHKAAELIRDSIVKVRDCD